MYALRFSLTFLLGDVGVIVLFNWCNRSGSVVVAHGTVER